MGSIRYNNRNNTSLSRKGADIAETEIPLHSPMNSLLYIFIAIAVVLIAIILVSDRRRFVATASFTIAIVGLGPALFLQVIIDKVLGQRSIEILNALGGMILLVVVLVSLGAFALDKHAKQISHRPNISPLALKLSIELPRVLLAFLILQLFSMVIAIITLLVTALGSGALFFCTTNQSIREALAIDDTNSSIFSRALPLSSAWLLSVNFGWLLWIGAYLVLDNQLTLGQFLSVLIISSQFILALLSAVNAIAQNRRASSGDA